MKINKVTINQSRTVQMRQFEPATISISIEAQVDPTDNSDTVIATLKKKVRDEVEKEADRLKTVRIESVDDPKEKSI